VRDTTSRVVVVSQGTVDNTDPDKLIVPTIEALKDEPCVVVATTGGVATDDLRGRYAAHPNVVVEDFVDYGTLLPRADVFVTSGGWGSTLAAIGAGVPLVGAGTREGKNDFNIRVEHNRLGVDLGTEHPRPAAIRAAVARVIGDPGIRTNVARAGRARGIRPDGDRRAGRRRARRARGSLRGVSRPTQDAVGH